MVVSEFALIMFGGSTQTLQLFYAVSADFTVTYLRGTTLTILGLAKIVSQEIFVTTSKENP